MSDNNDWSLTAAVAVACISALLAIVLPIAIISHNSTQRLEACVDSGGQYVHVSDTTIMECRR